MNGCDKLSNISFLIENNEPENVNSTYNHSAVARWSRMRHYNDDGPRWWWEQCPNYRKMLKLIIFFSKAMNKCCSLVRRKIFTASQGVVIKHFQEDETSAVIEVQRQSYIGRIIIPLENPQKTSAKSISNESIFNNSFPMNQFSRINFKWINFKEFLLNESIFKNSFSMNRFLRILSKNQFLRIFFRKINFW